MSEKCIDIPHSFRSSFFFTCNKLCYNTEKNMKELAEIPFLVDLMVIRGEVNERDVDLDRLILHLFQLWKTQKVKLSNLFKARDRVSSKPLMINGISWFVDLAHWTNGSFINTLTDIIDDCSELPQKPINIKERLSYIIQNPDHFHAFVQLSELYEELEKQWYTANRKKQHTDKK